MRWIATVMAFSIGCSSTPMPVVDPRRQIVFSPPPGTPEPVSCPSEQCPELEGLLFPKGADSYIEAFTIEAINHTAVQAAELVACEVSAGEVQVELEDELLLCRTEQGAEIPWWESGTIGVAIGVILGVLAGSRL